MEWIDLDEEQPCVDEIVLACDCENEFVTLGRLLLNGEFETMYLKNVEGDSVITHWMPLPETPLS